MSRSTPDPGNGRANERSRSRRWWWTVGALGVGALVGGAGAVFWLTPQPRPTQLELPPLPNFAGRPDGQREQLSKAYAAAASAHTLDSIATLARLFHANGFLSEAAACWQWLHAAQPREPRWSYYLADIYRTFGDYDRVESLLTETLKNAPNYSPGWLQLAELQFKSGRLDQAERSYQRRLALVANDPYARLGIIRIALQRGGRKAARQLLEQLVHDAPQFPPSRNLYAEILMTDGDPAAATVERTAAANAGRFREADDPWLDELHTWCFDPKQLVVLGTIELQTSHGDKGRSFMERAVELAPTDGSYAELLGDLYLKVGDTDKARALEEQSLKRVAAPSPMLYFILCEAYRIEQKPNEALRVVETGLARHPESYQLYNELGGILVDLGRLQDAAGAYRDALARAPTDTDSNFSLGETLLALGHREEAMTFLKRSLSLQPTYPKALITLGNLEMRAGNLDTAGQYFQALYDQHPDQDQARQLMAQWHLRMGLAAAAKRDAAAAEAHYKEGYALNPNQPELAMNLGIAYLVSGRPADAIAPLEAFHRLKPQDPQSSFFLGQTYAQSGRITEAKQCLVEGERLARQTGDQRTAGYCREILEHL